MYANVFLEVVQQLFLGLVSVGTREIDHIQGFVGVLFLQQIILFAEVLRETAADDFGRVRGFGLAAHEEVVELSATVAGRQFFLLFIFPHVGQRILIFAVVLSPGDVRLEPHFVEGLG